MRPDADKFAITLPAGWSRLLVKTTQADGGRGLSVKFCDSAGNRMLGIAYSTAPQLTYAMKDRLGEAGAILLFVRPAGRGD